MVTGFSLVCLVCGKSSAFYYGKYKNGFTCTWDCDEIHQAKLLKELNEMLERRSNVSPTPR